MTRDPWEELKTLTAARIALGRAGGSLPTREVLDFSLAHARARDAVWSPFDAESLASDLQELGAASIVLSSQARSRDDYLQYPDRGRALADESRQRLRAIATEPCDLAVVVADGLSARAAHEQVVPLLSRLLPQLREDGWIVGPVAIVRLGRVAIEDDVGESLGAELALILIGERPGLGSPDSLGAYFVHHPRRGKTDADRNCVSNIRPQGLPPEQAAATLHYLLTESRRRKLSGVGLKDERKLVAGEVQPSATTKRITSDFESGGTIRRESDAN